MLNRLPKRRSDRFIIIDTPSDTYEKWLYCDSCTERLVHRKKHDDLMCPNCGDVYPLDRGEDEYKNKGKLGTIEDNNSHPVIVQPQNRRPTSISLKQIKPYKQMMEDEIQKNGFTLIDSQWITRE